MHEIAYTVFTVAVTNAGSTEMKAFSELDSAIRYWDASTYNAPNCEGEIVVQSFTSDHIVVRDGNILHVKDGVVYLNPNLRLS